MADYDEYIAICARRDAAKRKAIQAINNHFAKLIREHCKEREARDG